MFKSFSAALFLVLFYSLPTHADQSSAEQRAAGTTWPTKLGVGTYWESTKYSSDVTPIDIMFDRNLPLRIPRAYLTNPKSYDGGVFTDESGLLTLDCIYPSMKPVMLAGDVRPGDMLIHISLSGGSNKNIYRNDWSPKEELQKVAPYLEPPQHGVSKLSPAYWEAVKEKKVLNYQFGSAYNYYITVAPDDRWVKILCEKNSNVRCSVVTNFNSHLAGTYYVDHNSVPNEWESVDRKIVELMQSFMTESKPPPTVPSKK